MVAILQTKFSNAFTWIKKKFHTNFTEVCFPKGQIIKETQQIKDIYISMISQH